MQQGGIALTSRGEEFNAAFAELYPFATNVDSVLAVLNRQSAATTTLLRDGGQVFSALSQSPAALQGFVRNTNSLFAATAGTRQRRWRTRSGRSRRSSPRPARPINRLATFVADDQAADRRAAPRGGAAHSGAAALVVLAPELRDLMIDIAPLTKASKAGFPALEHVPQRQRPVPGATEAVPRRAGPGDQLHQGLPTGDRGLLRQQHRHLRGPVRLGQRRPAPTTCGSPTRSTPRLLTRYADRPDSNRSNPYLAPGGYNALLHGLTVFGSYSLHRAIPSRR